MKTVAGYSKQLRLNRGPGKVALYVGLTTVVVLLGFPLYWMFASAVQEEHAIFSFPPTMVPFRTFTLEPLYKVFFLERRPMARMLWNSLMVSVVSSTASVLLGLWGGYALSRFRFRGRALVGFLILLTQMLPGSLIIIPLYMILTDLKLSNSLWGLTLTYMSFNTPFSIWMLKGFVEGIPKDLEEQGLIDGCSRMGALARITLPLMVPGIVATFIFGFIAAWGEYVFALTLLDSVTEWTYAVGVASLKGEYMVTWNEIMSASFVSTLPVLLLFLFMQRYLLAGLTAGGVKG
jgi:ABC-type glycerol-3-phosphate transport system permease component